MRQLRHIIYNWENDVSVHHFNVHLMAHYLPLLNQFDLSKERTNQNWKHCRV